MKARQSYDALYTTLAAAGYTPGDPSPEIAADARSAFPDSMVVFFGLWLFGRRLLSYRGFVISGAGAVLEF